jgi:undecaprenyl diphosphate synthase
LADQIDLRNIPLHIAIIMDGNGRWAKKKGAARVFGHSNALKAVRESVETCARLGVGYLTLFAFSTENWNRPKSEVEALMSLLVSTIRSETKTLLENNIKLATIGDTKALPEGCQKELMEAIALTSASTGMILTLALSYSGRWDICQAAKTLGKKIKSGELDPDQITEKDFEACLSPDAINIPDPELLIRTSGELRISNFFLWQSAYTELYFTEVLWPDFREKDIIDAVVDYQKRERRFGMISEQIKENNGWI